MKRIVSLLLLAVLVFTAFPFCISASENTETITPDDLYVTDGLTVWCDAFDGSTVPTRGTWQGNTGYVDLLGAWTAEENGRGITYANSSAFGYGSLTGVEIPPSLLGEGSYTVEALVAPKGVTDINTGERYTDSMGSITHDLAMEFGPFKAMAYPALAGATSSLSLHYYYAANGGYRDNNAEFLTWNSFLGMDADDAFTYSVNHVTDGVTSHYAVKNNALTANSIAISAEEYVPFTSSDCHARLFCYFPVTLYSVRVYDRALTDGERAQNHFADLCKYHGIDLASFWHLLSESERTELIDACANLSFYDGAHVFGSVVSSFLYNKVVMTDAFRGVAVAYGLDILAYLDSDRKEQIDAAMGDITGYHTAATVQKELDALIAGENVVEQLLVFERFYAFSEEEPEICAQFRIDTELAALLERNFTIRFGVLAGLSLVYATADALTLTEDGKAPKNAVVYTAPTNDASALSLTVYWPDANQNADDYQRDLRFRGFLELTDASGTKSVYYVDALEQYELYDQPHELSSLSMLDAAKYFVCEHGLDSIDSYTLYRNEALRTVLSAFRYSVPVFDETMDENRLLLLQYELKKGLEDALAVEDVLYCKTGSVAKRDSIWVEYLSDGVEGDSRIRPAYIYFPTDRDPSGKSTTTLQQEGVYRVFCYIGVPKGNEDFPGILCVHGGGGHAYINYVKEAVNHGYAAIAIDADGFTRSNPSAPDHAGGYVLDTLGMAKDSLADSDRDIEEQWMYYVQRALIYSNTVLRSFDNVREDSVGITGISWGGLTTTIAIGYDTRYAFAVPVYLSGNMDESMGSWSADFFRKGLWYNDELLKNAKMPVLVLNSDEDRFASLNTSALTYNDLPNAQMCIMHQLGHSQQRGASLSEIYTFADYAVGYDVRMPFFEQTPDESYGDSYTLTVEQNERLESYTATLYYLTEPVTYGDGTNAMRTEWRSVELSVTDGKVDVTVPDDACVYYISLSAYSRTEAFMPQVYIKYTGYVTSSTPLISTNGNIYR